MSEKTLGGRPSIFRKTDKAIPELGEAETGERSDSQTVKQPRVKATFYLNPEDIVAIDQMQTEDFKRTGKKPERSHIVSRAIQNLLRQQND
ncbi:MAG: hypothetical protein M3437_07120 [Chloroflexota bacterium]|jgi:hypothetical protein|nr:hypothetical protein [Chloroflexota bacterium]